MIEKILLNVSSLAVLVPFLVALLRFPQVKAQLPYIFIYLLITVLASVSAQLLWWKHINNLFIFHIYTVVEFQLISSFYLMLMPDNRMAQRIIFPLQDLFVVLAVLSALYIPSQSLQRFNSFPRAFEAVAVIGMAIALFREMLRELKITSLSKSARFWINTAFLFYYSGNFFLFLLGTMIIDSVPAGISRVIWSFSGVLTILMYLLISVGLWNINKT